MILSRYYIRVSEQTKDSFESHLIRYGIEFRVLAMDYVGQSATTLYSVLMKDDDALHLRLSLPVIGFLNFTRTLSKQPTKGTDDEQD